MDKNGESKGKIMFDWSVTFSSTQTIVTMSARAQPNSKVTVKISEGCLLHLPN